MTQKLAPPRVVGVVGASLLNINGMIGAGIFALPALLYAGVGNFAPFAILLFALPLACVALLIGKLSTMFEQSGGGQLYIEKALGKFSGFQVGWFITCASSVGRAANFHVFVSYLAALFPIFGGTIARPITIIVAVALIVWLTVVGAKRSVSSLGLGTILKLAPLFLLVAVGFGVNGVPTEVELPTFTGLESIILLIAYAFSGATTSNNSAGETKDPTRTVFRSILYSLAGVAVVYAAIQWAYIAIGPEAGPGGGTDDAPLASAAQKLFGDWGAVMISVAAVFSIATNQLSGFIAYPRVLFGMGERGLLPRFFAHVSPRHSTPDYAIISYGVFVAVIAASGTFALLATLLVAIEMVIYVLLLIAFVALWRRDFRGMRETTGPFWWAVFAGAIALTLWLISQLPLTAILPTLGMLAIGAGLYFLAMKRTAYESSQRGTG